MEFDAARRIFQNLGATPDLDNVEQLSRFAESVAALPIVRKEPLALGPGVRLGPYEHVVTVRAVSERRGPASVAATLYEETAESMAERERHAAERRLSRPLGADLGARPTKQARRRLDALRRGRQRPGGS